MVQKDFILILGEIPNKLNEQDGMIQRELAIDSLLRDRNRIYVETTIVPELFYLKFPKKYLKTIIHFYKNRLSYFGYKKVKTYKIITEKKLHKLCSKASKIYIHSLYHLHNINKPFLKEFMHKIILDIHGCVIEEMELYNVDQNIIYNMQQTEKDYFNSINSLIAVSNNMINYYKNKYPNIKTNFLLLPIFNKNELKKETFNKKLKIIYSGGTQKWQNIDLMIEAIKKLFKDFDITILTPDIEIFKQKLGSLTEFITIKTVTSKELPSEYRTADLGFILRDNSNVNKVACPTKLIEYLQFGIIPIIKQPEIGDFASLGYQYIKLDDLLCNGIPSLEELSKIRINNYLVIDKLNKQHDIGMNQLQSLLKN